MSCLKVSAFLSMNFVALFTKLFCYAVKHVGGAKVPYNRALLVSVLNKVVVQKNQDIIFMYMEIVILLIMLV